MGGRAIFTSLGGAVSCLGLRRGVAQKSWWGACLGRGGSSPEVESRARPPGAVEGLAGACSLHALISFCSLPLGASAVVLLASVRVSGWIVRQANSLYLLYCVRCRGGLATAAALTGVLAW